MVRNICTFSHNLTIYLIVHSV
ncbi:hypothetical protein AZZ65_005098, partial [Escherichia coli]